MFSLSDKLGRIDATEHLIRLHLLTEARVTRVPRNFNEFRRRNLPKPDQNISKPCMWETIDYLEKSSQLIKMSVKFRFTKKLLELE